ncbi:G patch domain-containing protein 4 [Neocloeon triangulifer]|uniref:G patch domain-containing protein 4 n=1 Tax=Neocloeon triangulifer TaxID=2078957 RepID=UPI00286F06F9|nr:G patch domain-containing protein 4 [Neocloeon triangulifer]
MDFAKAQLEKYGWKEGEGLGAQKTGISKAIRPGLKRDRMGLGADPAEEFTNNWWNKAYDKAAQNVEISVNDAKDSVKVKTVKKKAKKKAKEEPVKKIYSNFVKSSVLEDNEEVESKERSNQLDVTEEEKAKEFVPLSDEQLFKACGGRTAHKAARHGHKLSGKLARLQQQDESFKLVTRTSL